MSTSKTWPGGSTNVTPTTYSIPAAGEVNWANLSNFLNALGDGAQATTFQKFAVRVATTTPVTFSTNDCIVATNLTVAGAVAVTLPAGSNKLVAFIVDRKGDAKTNNITITPNGAETINGAATLVLNGNNQGVMLVFNSSASDWEIVLNSIADGGSVGGFLASRAIVSDSGGYLTSATTTATEIGYVNGVTSAIQTQLDAKQARATLTTKGDLYVATASATVTRQAVGTDNYVFMADSGQTTGVKYALLVNANVDAAAAITLSKLAALTASRAVVTDGSGVLTVATTTSTEIGYVNGVTSAIQTQLNAKAANPLTTTGDIIYASNTATPATPARLGIGATSTVLQVSGGLPSWSLVVNANVDSAAAIAYSKLAALTASRALVSDGSGFVSVATTTSTQIGYLSAATGTTGTTSTNIVFSTSPTLVTPTLGVASATSINKMAITAPATSSTLAVADGKTFTVSNTLTLAGTDGNTMTFPSGSSTVMTLASTDTITGAKSFNDGKLILNGSSSGTSTLKAQATAGTTTFTLPTTTGTLVGSGDTGTVTSTMILDGTIVNADISSSAAIAGSKISATGVTVQQFTSGSGTYTTPAGCTWIEVEVCAGGGGGQGSGTGAGNGGAGTGSTFTTTAPANVFVTTGGGQGTGGLGGAGGGGTVTSPGIGIPYGGTGGGGVVTPNSATGVTGGGVGGAGPYGGGGASSFSGQNAGSANSGGGGSGGGMQTSGLNCGAGGGGGGFVKGIITSPAASYLYSVGGGGSAGSAGTSGFAGGAGGSGRITVWEHYI